MLPFRWWMFGGFRFVARRGGGSWRWDGAHLFARFEEELFLFFLSQLGPRDRADECSYEQQTPKQVTPVNL